MAVRLLSRFSVDFLDERLIGAISCILLEEEKNLANLGMINAAPYRFASTEEGEAGKQDNGSLFLGRIVVLFTLSNIQITRPID